MGEKTPHRRNISKIKYQGRRKRAKSIPPTTQIHDRSLSWLYLNTVTVTAGTFEP